MHDTIVDNEDAFLLFNEEIVKHEVGAIDIETTIANPFRGESQLVSVAITFDGEHSFVFGPGAHLRQMKQPLERIRWIMHNGLFDKLMMHIFGYDLELAHDTMAMQYLLDPDEPKSLEELSLKYLGLEGYKDVDYDNILDEPFEKIAAMNAEDVRRTFNLYRPLADQLNREPQLSKIYQWLLMPAVTELIRVSLDGMPVDGGRLAVLTAQFEEKTQALLEELRAVTPPPIAELYGKDEWKGRKRKSDPPPPFNPGSVEQVRHILYDVWKMPVLNVTDTGTPTTDADTLLLLETEFAVGEQEKWLAQLRDFRKANKVLTGYLQAWPSMLTDEGRLHSRYKPLHVVTGRLSSEKPNMQNVPRTKDFRNVFGGVEGMAWVKADYSQIELRLAAWAAQEQTMLKAYREGLDLHEMTAMMVLGDSTPDARQVGKTLNFGLLYGAGPETLRRIARTNYGVFLDKEEATQYREDFFASYPDLARWHKSLSKSIQATGMSISPLGRRRFLPYAKIPWDVEDMKGKKIHAILEGTNHPIQSMASDLLLMSLVRVSPKVRPLGVQIVAEVHDEIDFLVPEERVEEVTTTIKATMEDLSWLERFGVNLTVPVVAEVSVGKYWGDTE